MILFMIIKNFELTIKIFNLIINKKFLLDLKK